MATVVSLTYLDGREEEVRLKSLDFVKAERRYKGVMPAVEGSLYAAWLRLSPGGTFETWLDSIDDHRVSNESGPPLALEPPPEQ